MAKKTLPPYITIIYGWLYQKSKTYNFLNSSLIQNILTLGYHNILINELKKEITPHAQILQTGVTLGAQITNIYSLLDETSSYTIMDIHPRILIKCEEKHPNCRINYINADAAKPFKGDYDTIICYMLLHELPPVTRKKVLTNILNALPIGGKAIFIDYHLPSQLNPLKYFIRAINRLYQPFAEALWKTSIKEMVPNKENYSWSKQTYFSGTYQKVVATRDR